mmetsp:Transcript_15605/g.37471  ORF Transcript_15605/g.37471 Transcript_15605/m.37471 type:complete len:88 (+) Transcript_15605:3418-3681(+)
MIVHAPLLKGHSLNLERMAWSINRAETMAPQISFTVSTFMHNLLFHGKMLKHNLNFIPFDRPKLDQHSDIFRQCILQTCSLLLAHPL